MLTGPATLSCDAQASRDTAASAAVDQLRRDQLALKQSKQLIPILASAGKGKPYKSPAAAQSTATALANGNKTSALLNGGLPRKSSLESLGRMSSQVNMLLYRAHALHTHSKILKSCDMTPVHLIAAWGHVSHLHEEFSPTFHLGFLITVQ